MLGLVKGCAVIVSLIALGSGSVMAAEACAGEGGLTKSGTLVASAKSVGFMAGIRWGGGEVTLNNGQKFNFKFKGLKLLDTGAAATDFVGEVYNLKRVEDFIGVYYGAAANLKIVKGKGEVVVNNSKCVVVKAKASGMGIQLSAPAPGGVYVQLAE
jgi:hypothetical protein